MQVNKCDSNVNFQRIRSINCEGLFKKYPRASREVLDSFKSSAKAMQFCDTHDVDIFLRTCKLEMGAVDSEFIMLYKNLAPESGSIAKLLHKIKSPKRIRIGTYNNAFDTTESFKNGVTKLKQNLSPYEPNEKFSGVLESHIDYVTKEEDALLKKQTEQSVRKENKLNQNALREQSKNMEQKNLDDLINDLTK
jgi:hypothetical protein